MQAIYSHSIELKKQFVYFFSKIDTQQTIVDATCVTAAMTTLAMADKTKHVDVSSASSSTGKTIGGKKAVKYGIRGIPTNVQNCYINAVAQVLFHVTEIRNIINEFKKKS